MTEQLHKAVTEDAIRHRLHKEERERKKAGEEKSHLVRPHQPPYLG